MEHPCLPSLKLTLDAAAACDAEAGLLPLTVDALGATPCAIANVPRVCRIDTAPRDDDQGLYGRHFASAPFPRVLGSTTFLCEPPSRSNILAMEAPKPSRGTYTHGQVTRILSTAYAGFGAAARVSRGELLARAGVGGSVPPRRCVVHTGHWGCGAYGGSRQLTALLQAVAARLAGVGLVYHGVDAAGAAEVRKGVATLEGVVAKLTRSAAAGDAIGGGGAGGASVDVAALVNEVVGLEFAWGQSDGN